MMQDFGLEDLDVFADHIIDTSYRGTLDAIAEVTPGGYHNILTVDRYEREMELHATLTVTKDWLHLDFAGTSGCSSKGINVPLNYATAYSVFAMRCIIGSDIPTSAGSLQLFVVTGPTDCILNAQRPTPVVMRHILGKVTPDLVLDACHRPCLAKCPPKGHLAYMNCPCGARPHADGLSATAYPSGVFGSQVEITEAIAPVTIWRRELLPDSCGAGQFRGGLGQQIEMTSAIAEPFLVFLSVERVKNAPNGPASGQPGAAGRIRVTGRDADIPSKCELWIEPGERLTFDTPGGGGFDKARDRDTAALERDVENGLVTPAAAVADYGRQP